MKKCSGHFLSAIKFGVKKIHLTGVIFIYALLVVCLPIFESYAADATFTWTANTETNLASYRIHYGTASKNYTQVKEIPKTETTANVSELSLGQTYYFAATALNTDNIESDYSAEVVWTAQAVGNQPVAENGVLETTEGAAKSGRLVATDIDGDTLTYSIDTNGNLGSAVITNAATGDYTYIPNTGAIGVDTFTFTASDGTFTSAVAEITVTIAALPVPPVAVITTQEITGSPYAMRFDGTVSSDHDGTIVSYLWNFGDGNIGTDPIMEHLYSVTGEYSVSLTVTDDSGAEALDVVTVIIVGEVGNAPPVAQFTATASEENSALINFDATASFDSDGEIASYSWNFGDGSTASGAIAFHEYEISGRYSVTLVVMDNDGEAIKYFVDVDVVVPERFFMESGEILVTSSWQWVAFSEPIENAVVVAKPVSSNDTNPVVVRISDVQSTGFNIGLQYWEYLGQDHVAEKVGFIAMSAGNFELDNGAGIEAGTFVTDGAEIFGQNLFVQSFQVAPIVAASITSANEDDAVTGRIRNITTSGFEYRMQEQMANNSVHLAETVSYIAWEPSSGMVGDIAYDVKMSGQDVTHEWAVVPFSTVFGLTPIIVADMQTAVDIDTANLRYQGISTTQIQLRVVEEQSLDEDVTHGAEQVGLIVLGIIDRAPDDLTADLDLDNSVDGLDLMLYVNDPAAVSLEEVAAQFGLIH